MSRKGYFLWRGKAGKSNLVDVAPGAQMTHHSTLSGFGTKYRRFCNNLERRIWKLSDRECRISILDEVPSGSAELMLGDHEQVPGARVSFRQSLHSHGMNSVSHRESNTVDGRSEVPGTKGIPE